MIEESLESFSGTSVYFGNIVKNSVSMSQAVVAVKTNFYSLQYAVNYFLSTSLTKNLLRVWWHYFPNSRPSPWSHCFTLCLVEPQKLGRKSCPLTIVFNPNFSRSTKPAQLFKPEKARDGQKDVQSDVISHSQE